MVKKNLGLPTFYFFSRMTWVGMMSDTTIPRYKLPTSTSWWKAVFYWIITTCSKYVHQHGDPWWLEDILYIQVSRTRLIRSAKRHAICVSLLTQNEWLRIFVFKCNRAMFMPWIWHCVHVTDCARVNSQIDCVALKLMFPCHVSSNNSKIIIYCLCRPWFE